MEREKSQMTLNKSRRHTGQHFDENFWSKWGYSPNQNLLMEWYWGNKTVSLKLLLNCWLFYGL